jgi:signal-transduction protein with cAMP-binding, CBS, and nucleotidyltransferase domain
VAEADVVRKVVATGLDPSRIRVSEIMSAPLIAVDIRTPVYEIYRTMAEKKIRHIVITENGAQAGFVSVKDLLRRPLI